MIYFVHFVLILSLGIGLPLPAQTIADVPSQYPTITAALASGADIIRVAAGTYNESIVVGAVHLIGAGAATTTINGGAAPNTVEAPATSYFTPVIQGFTITGSGHGVYLSSWSAGSGHSIATLVDCVIMGTGGAGIRLNNDPYHAPEVHVVRCHIHGCATGVDAPAGSLRMIGCTVEGNGAGVLGPFYGGLTVIDSLVVSNLGSGIHLLNGSVRNCTIVGNGHGVQCLFSNVITNTICWGNSSYQVSGVPGMDPQVSWCDVQGGYPGTGNINADPLFTDPLNGDYSLAPGSPCIDAGDPSEIDPDGSRTDIGFRPNLPLLPGFAVNYPPVLAINTWNAGLDRRIDVPVGQAISFFVDSYLGGENFLVLGYLGVPSFAEQLAIPAVGALAFPPPIPGLGTPACFTLTNNLFPDPSALIPSSPTPWSVTFPNGIPTPIQITFQAVTLVQGTGFWNGFFVSNAVLLNVY